MAEETVVQQEARNWLGVPKPFQTIDLLGAALGAYFIYDGMQGWKGRRRYPAVNLALGAVMVYIHLQRFSMAPQTAEGLLKLVQWLYSKEPGGTLTPGSDKAPTAVQGFLGLPSLPDLR